MSLRYMYVCDGGCGRVRRDSLPETWESFETWDDGSRTLHYCEQCRKRRKAAR